MTTELKPTTQSVAIVIKDEAARVLVVKRADHDDSLPGVWGLPAATIRGDETPEQAALRAAKDKLGVNVKVLRYIGDDTLDQGRHINHLREYEVEILSGRPAVPQRDQTVSQYADLTYTSDPTILFEAARQGSLCSRIYLRDIDLEWEAVGVAD